jgi:pimeloyl-ACP methyl ester carboxylesterase
VRLHRDGLALGYEESGAGEPSLLLVHGWGTRRGVFEPLVRTFSDTHRVVAVDLRGHGESDASVENVSVETFAEDAAWLASALDLLRPVIIGHSLGGLVALEFASRFDARAAILLECHVAAPPSVAAALEPAIARLETAEYRVTAGALLGLLLGERFDPALRAEMIAYARSLPQRVLSQTLRAALAYDGETAAARIRCPILYVGSPTPYANLPRFRELCPELATAELVDCGHYFPLEVPEQLHPVLRRFLSSPSAP